jgi:plasmid rolling circle replication initiator protein Rep
MDKDYILLSEPNTSIEPELVASFPLSDASPKDKPWDSHRKNADKVGEMYSQLEYNRYSERISDCSQRLGFALQRCESTGELQFRLQSAKFCRVRLCPVCQWRRSLMWRARFFKAMPKLLEAHPKANFIFLTLTVKNCPVEELKATIGAMNQAWHRLIKRKAFPADGWVKSVEITRGKDGLAHPHFHAVLMVKPSYFSGSSYLSQAKWTELWRSSLRIEYTPVVNVKVVKGKTIEDGIAKALCETLKYSVKEGDLTVDRDWLEAITNQLHKTRAIAIGGIFKDYLSEEEPEDLIHAEDEIPESSKDDPTFYFGWRENLKRYMSE